MNKVQVYDAPTRLFHFLFSFGFLAAFGIGKFVDDEQTLYGVHMIIGLTLAFTLIWRGVWGFVGGRYARWNTWDLSLSSFKNYFKNITNSQKSLPTGHHSASSWSALLMILFSVLMALTGVSLVLGVGGETAQEIHEIISTIWIIMAGLHIGGALFQHVLLKDKTALTMYTGQKHFPDTRAAETKMSYGWALAFLAATALFFSTLLLNYSFQTGQLQLLNRTFQLSEAE